MIEIGKIYESKKCGSFKVLRFVYSYNKKRYYEIEFLKTGFKKITQSDLIRTGGIKDLYLPVVLGKGFAGETNKEIFNLFERSKIYDLWYSMMERCYNEKNKKYNIYGAKGVYVCDKWLNFSNFLNDIEKIKGWNRELFFGEKREIYLDKDKNQIDAKNKYYSLETCEWLSVEENCALTSKLKYFKAISPDGIEYIYNRQREFSRKFNLNFSGMNRCLRGERKTHRGWKFEYIEKENIVNG